VLDPGWEGLLLPILPVHEERVERAGAGRRSGSDYYPLPCPAVPGGRLHLARELREREITPLPPVLRVISAVVGSLAPAK